MNNFCKDCPHQLIPVSLKNKWDSYVGETFTDCPQRDKKVIYCFIKKNNIDWEGFLQWLQKNKRITDSELKELLGVI